MQTSGKVPRMGTSGNGRGRPSKVVRLIDRYGLDGLGAELEDLWTTERQSERKSLRELADYFNRRMLEKVLTETGSQPLDGEVENIYRLLEGADASAADRTRVERRLEREGIDVEALRSDFVSYQAIRTYLRKHRDAEYSPQTADRTEKALENIQRLRSRMVTVTESKLDQMKKGDELSLGETRVTVDVRVFCSDCGQQFDVGTLLDRGGCDCSSTARTDP